MPRAFIIGTSKSIDDVDLHKLDGEITFGVNALPRKYQPTYYCIIDWEFIRVNWELIGEGKYKRLFVGKALLEKAKNLAWYKNQLNHAIAYNHIDHVGFSTDINEGYYDGGSVCLFALQVAHSMGFSPLYLIGSEFDYSGNTHYFGNEDKLLMKKREEKLGSSYEMPHHENRALESLAIAVGKGVKIFSCMKRGEVNKVLKYSNPLWL